jgi:hypothetical protein
MHSPSYLHRVRFRNLDSLSTFLGQFAVLVFLFTLAIPGFAAKVPVRDGQLLRLKLRNILTTDNVQKGDGIEFEVMEDILVSGHVVIAKGATARGKVLDVKGAGKPKAKDAEVVFQFITVHAVDNQELPLRLQPTKSRNPKPSENEIAERSPIPGYPSRLIGAEKGKEYKAYTEGSFVISAADTIATPTMAPAVATPAAPAAAPAAPVTAPAAPALGLAPEPASVEFSSVPDGADILIDGTFVGNTPSTLRVTPGHHAIEIRMAGYHSWTRTMVVDPESHPSVRATLAKE